MVKVNIESQVRSITVGSRQSNIELLRIVAMFLVLVVHADFLSLGVPSPQEFHTDSVAAYGRMFFESLAIVSVNVFVLISGWFTIKPTIKGICNFLFQYYFLAVAIYAVGILSGKCDANVFDFIFSIGLIQYSGYWFIKAYLILYVLSPVLNSFVMHASKRTMLMTLAGFLILQSIWSSISWLNTAYFQRGYSPLSFIGLYILAHTIRRYYSGVTMRSACLIFLISLISLFVFSSVVYAFGLSFIPINFFAYSNPLVIAESVGLMLIFTKLTIRPNRIINWISASSFAVYIIHIHPVAIGPYTEIVNRVYDNTNSIMTLLCIALFLIGVFAVAIIFDQPRKVLWNLISPYVKQLDVVLRADRK